MQRFLLVSNSYSSVVTDGDFQKPRLDFSFNSDAPLCQKQENPI